MRTWSLRMLTRHERLLKGFYCRAAHVEAPASTIAWRGDLDAALAEARRTGRPVLVDFSASWCPPCIAMKHEVWPDPAIERAVLESYVPHPACCASSPATEPAANRDTIASMFTPKPIGFVKSPYTRTKDIPKGAGARHDADGTLEILPEFELGLTDIEGFSHLFVLWVFDRSEGFDLLGMPPTDDRPHGVFATRSPRRPNPIGLTVVELLRREGRVLHVRGVDMLDDTPILDIKPQLSSVPENVLRRGWLAEAEARGKR